MTSYSGQIKEQCLSWRKIFRSLAVEKTARSTERSFKLFDRDVNVQLIAIKDMGNSSSVYQRGMSTAGSRYQAFGNTSSTRPYSDYRYQQLGSGRPTSTYSRYAGAGLGFYTHNSQAGNRGHGRSVYIGRERLAEVRGISSDLCSVIIVVP